MQTEPALNFGPFTLQPAHRVLLEGAQPVHLGGRAFDLLLALLERPGEVLSTPELLARVWPGSVVEPGSVRVHLSALRKALGDGRNGRRFIINVPPGGYCFVEPLGTAAAAAVADPALLLPGLPPAPVLIGRAELVDELVQQLPQRRLLTLVGPGGIGKTSLALAALPRLAGAYAQGLRYVELAPLSDEPRVLGALAAALGLALPARTPLQGLAAYLRDKNMLIVLDNCEQVIDAVARLAEALLLAAPDVHLLATSREPLRIPGEWVQRLGSLRVPPAGALDAAEVLTYPAAQLFLERASASLGAIELAADEAQALGAICRGLDGIPLAIELAAASVDAFGLRGLAGQLDHGLALLTHGRRTALPRHRTLRATLDWSHGLLSEGERRLLRRLAVFRSHFTLAGALAICDDDGGGDTAELLASLVAKSLLNADMRGEPVQYWLLEVTREYAAERLAESGEGALLARRHAVYLCRLFEHAAAERERSVPAQWLARYGRGIADLRAAMVWALGPAGDA
ncbi:MAG TPA: winged helix-turn-helix domain-containing protein, partial [Roseateles sp.]|nr:winged helix-turn-helix domain-containing protein [Roseateles sp.]